MRHLDDPNRTRDNTPGDDQLPRTPQDLDATGLTPADRAAFSGPAGVSRFLRLRWTLHATQYAFVTSPARFSFFVGGLGSGKTTAGAVRAILRARDHQGSLGFVGGMVYPCRNCAQSPLRLA